MLNEGSDDGPTAQEGPLRRVLRTVTPAFLRRRYSRKFLATFLLVVLVIATVGVVNVLQINQTTTAAADEDLRSETTFRATLLSQWVQSMATQTQLISANAEPRALSLSDAQWQSSADVTAIHYVNVTASEIVASTDLNSAGRPLAAIDTPWTALLDRVEVDDSADSTVWVTNRSYRRGTERVVGFVSPGEDPGTAVVVIGTTQSVVDNNTSGGHTTAVVTTDGTVVFGSGLDPATGNTSVLDAVSRSGTTRLVDQGDRLAVYAPVDGANWLVVTQAEKAAVFQAARAVESNVIGIVITSILMLFLVGIALGRHTVLPLTRLREQTQRLADGTFDIDLTTARIDEFGLLYRDFATMRDKLQQQIRDSEQKQAELEELTARLQLALEETDTGVWELDLDTDEVFWDDACEQLFAYEPGTFPGTYEAFADRVFEADLPDVEREIERAIDTGERYQADFRIQHPDGTRHWLQSRGVVEYHDDGEPKRMFGVQTDVTDRKEYERELEDTNKKLELLNRIVRHDIRNDMHVVLAYTNQVADEVTDPQHSEYLSKVRDSSEHVVELTDVVRDLMETMLGDGETTEPMSIDGVLERELDSIRLKHEHVTVEGPEQTATSPVQADEMLGTVFRNLLTNAVRHNNSDQPELTVSVTETDDTVRVAIADNGPGVPDEQKEDIFGRGEKGLESPGTGVGLYLVDTVVSGYGGEVWVKDAPCSDRRCDHAESDDTGAVFVVDLPRADGGSTDALSGDD